MNEVKQRIIQNAEEKFPMACQEIITFVHSNNCFEIKLPAIESLTNSEHLIEQYLDIALAHVPFLYSFFDNLDIFVSVWLDTTEQDELILQEMGNGLKHNNSEMFRFKLADRPLPQRFNWKIDSNSENYKGSECNGRLSAEENGFTKAFEIFEKQLMSQSA